MENSIIFLTFFATIIFEVIAKRKVEKDQVLEDSLTLTEKVVTWIVCILNPVLAGAILYYGWKKQLPNKAKQANKISMMAFIAEVVLGGILFFLLAA